MWPLKKLNHQKTPQTAAALWGADSKTLKLVCDGINVVYRFEKAGKGCYLRISHPEIRKIEAIKAAIDYQQHLFHHQAPVCQPLMSINHQYVEKIIQDQEIFFVQVAAEVPGEPINMETQDQLVFEKWGSALAKLHQAVKTYEPPKDYQFKTWQDIWDEMVKYIASEDEIIKKEYHSITAWFQNLSQTKSNFGLTHGDHRAANVLYDDKQVHIIDFDEPVCHWFMADIARPFLNLCQKPFTQWKPQFDRYIQGYQIDCPIDPELLGNISWFLRMKNLEIYLWTKNNWHDEVAPGGGSTKNWLNELRAFQEKIIHEM